VTRVLSAHLPHARIPRIPGPTVVADFDSIAAKDISFAMHRLNPRPKKYLGFKTPHEIFMKQLQLY
jgi:IS30 family transposase